MAVELKDWLRDKLASLPENHPDRTLLRKVQSTVEDYTAVNYQEIKNNPKNEFTPDQREFLIRNGYVIYDLSGVSLNELGSIDIVDEENKKEGSLNITTIPTEAAIRPVTFFPEEYARKYESSIPKGTKSVIGEANQYGELAIKHYEETTQGLFGSDGYQYEYTNWIRTNSNICVAFLWGKLQVSFRPALDQDMEIKIVVPERYQQ